MARHFTMLVTSPFTIRQKIMNILWPHLSCFGILCFVMIFGLWFWRNIIVWVHVYNGSNVIIWWIDVFLVTCTIVFFLCFACSTSTLHFLVGISPVLFQRFDFWVWCRGGSFCGVIRNMIFATFFYYFLVFGWCGTVGITRSGLFVTLIFFDYFLIWFRVTHYRCSVFGQDGAFNITRSGLFVSFIFVEYFVIWYRVNQYRCFVSGQCGVIDITRSGFFVSNIFLDYFVVSYRVNQYWCFIYGGFLPSLFVHCSNDRVL